MISTGLTKLDDFLGGGLSVGVIVDVFGASGTGKTLLLLQIAVNAAKHGNVLYLDTTGGFRPERIIELQNKQNMGFDALERITVFRITNTPEQIRSLEKIQDSDFSIVLVDNVTDLFSYEYPNEKSTFEKNSLFMKFMHNLSHIAISKKIPVVITNMIRHIDGKELENMSTAIDPYTHVKIRLSKNNSKFSGQSEWLEHKTQFDYTITSAGIH